jgi:NAD+ kinase
MKLKFNNIGIMGKQRTAGVADTVLALIDFLRAKKINILLENNTAKLLPGKLDLPVVAYKEIAKKCDLLIVVGGDGCILNAAHVAVLHNVPIIGINRGRLGFLTDIKPDEINEKVGAILQGKFKEEKRFLLTTCFTSKKQTNHNIALNDFVLTTGATAQMIEFEIYIDEKFMCSMRSDGLIIATPTGSTAYALSGGGPILSPVLDAVVLVPMFSHTLSSRPIVIDANSKIKIYISEKTLTPPQFSCDGNPYVEINPGDCICVQKMPDSLRLIHPMDYDYFETLRSKLYWGQRLTDIID